MYFYVNVSQANKYNRHQCGDLWIYVLFTYVCVYVCVVHAFCERPTAAERTDCDHDGDKVNLCINIIYVKLL